MDALARKAIIEVARRRGCPPQVAEDVVHDALERVLQMQPPPEHPIAFLRTVVQRRATDAVRAHTRQRRILLGAPGAQPGGEDEDRRASVERLLAADGAIENLIVWNGTGTTYRCVSAWEEIDVDRLRRTPGYFDQVIDALPYVGRHRQRKREQVAERVRAAIERSWPRAVPRRPSVPLARLFDVAVGPVTLSVTAVELVDPAAVVRELAEPPPAPVGPPTRATIRSSYGVRCSRGAWRHAWTGRRRATSPSASPTAISTPTRHGRPSHRSAHRVVLAEPEPSARSSSRTSSATWLPSAPVDLGEITAQLDAMGRTLRALSEGMARLRAERHASAKGVPNWLQRAAGDPLTYDAPDPSRITVCVRVLPASYARLPQVQARLGLRTAAGAWEVLLRLGLAASDRLFIVGR